MISTLTFTRPFESSSKAPMVYTKTKNGTEISQKNDGVMPTYFQRDFTLMMDGMLGPQFEKGLEHLKSRIE